MKLTRLIVQGFKSFKDRTTIEFDDGITGIVGPNGCGKSNIVDALFWVMGAQSAKHLRGKSMKDLIFAGSSKYNPGAFAEVTLVLENEEGKHIHIGNKVCSPTEIQLTRKLYRNGDTEYRINGEPSRLKDIQEVFMDTGAGAKSYSIIAQGEINRLVQSKPEERRSMIEDVAGITKFKHRKKESMRKIEATESNLARLQDLQVEIEKNLRALQKQAEKAERARNLKEKVKRNDIVVNAHKVFDHLKDLRDGRLSINEKTIELETWTTQKNNLEVSLEEERFKKEEQAEKIEDLSKERNEISNKLAASEERLNSLCNSLSDKEKQIETREEERKGLDEELEERQLKLKELEEQLSEVAAQEAEGFDFSDLEARVENLKEELDLKNEAVSTLREEIESEKDDHQKLEQIIFQNNSKLEEFAASLQDITEEVEVLENQYSGVSTQIADERDAVHTAESKLSELENKDISLKTEIETLTQEYKFLSNSFKEKQKEFISTESRFSSLKEINESLEGVKEGASEFLNTDETNSFQLLGTLIKCDEQYTKAVQNLLEDFMDTMVSATDEVDSLYSWMNGNSDKAIDFLLANKSADLTSPESVERLSVALGSELIALSDVITLPEEYKARLTPFFDGYFLAKSLEQSKLSSLSFDIKYKAVSSFDGANTIRNTGNGKLLQVAGASDKAQGAIARNNKISELEAAIEVLTVELSEVEQKFESADKNLEEMKVEHDQIRNELSEVKADHAAKKSALESKLSGMETGTARLDILKNRKNEISKSRLDLLESEESLATKRDSFQSILDERTTRLEELNEDLETIRASYDEEKEQLMEKSMQAKTFEDRLKAYSSQTDDIKAQIEKHNQRIEANTVLVEGLSEEVENTSEEIETLETSNQDEAGVLQDKDEVLSMFKDQFSELLLAMQEREEQVKKLSKNITAHEKIINETEIKAASALTEEEEIVRNIFEKYHVDLRTALGNFLEYSEDDHKHLNDVQTMYVMETEEGPKDIQKEHYEFTRRYGQDLKDCAFKFKQYKTEYNRLGEINWQAIEDYDRQKLRFDFLKTQEAELKQSLEDLQNAIDHIDEKSRERFKSAFEEVNMRFEKVFPIIFGGGSAMLKVTGNIDDPECGVDIIAKPPGKKMQNINLMSGGEKAMTAVSLIFSIFLVKPSPFCLLDEVDAPLDDANVGRFNELLREMSTDSQFILITHNKKTMELNDTLYGVTMQEPGVSKAVSVQLH